MALTLTTAMTEEATHSPCGHITTYHFPLDLRGQSVLPQFIAFLKPDQTGWYQPPRKVCVYIPKTVATSPLGKRSHKAFKR